MIGNRLFSGLFLIALFACTSKKKDTLFSLVENSNINFVNTLEESKEYNVFKYRNFYNGGGVATGDINNDGLADVFFTANQSANKLYLNKGNLQFEDISEKAGFGEKKQWSTGVVFVDINADGWLDIYVCNAGNMLDKPLRKNQLFINNHNLTFTDKAAEYGLDNDGYSTQASFFDFDLDGDLDCFLVNNSPIPVNTLNYANMRAVRDPDAPFAEFLKGGGDHLYRNDNGKFVDISKEAGIFGSIISFGLGVTVGDVNLDGYPDVYVGNYFTDYDGGLKEISDATIVNAGKTAKGYLYENDGGKRFVEVSEDYGITQKGFSFGGVFTDFDNDNDLDIIVNNDFGYKANHNYLLENHYPQKKFTYVEKEKSLDLRINAMGAATADINADGHLDYFISNIRFNRFMIYDSDSKSYVDKSEELGTQLFSISWGTNFADFDQDGDLDLFVANGDLNPNCVPMYNFYFENIDGTFIEKSNVVGLKDYGISRGSVVFDLENDGDLDLLVIAQTPVMEYGPPSITRLYKNDLIKGNHLKVKLISRASAGPHGARLELYADSLYINNEIDGGNTSHLSHNTTIAHFGLGDRSKIDSLVVTWLGGDQQKMFNISANQTVDLTEIREQKPSNNKTIIILIVSSIIISIIILRKLKYPILKQ